MANNDIDFDIKGLKDIKDKISDISLELYSWIDALQKSITGANNFSSATTNGLKNVHKQLSRINDDYFKIRNNTNRWTREINENIATLKKLKIVPNHTNRETYNNILSTKGQLNNAFSIINANGEANGIIDDINDYFRKGGYRLNDTAKETLGKTLDNLYDYLDKINDYSKGTSRKLDERVRGEKAYQDALKGVGVSSEYTTKQLIAFNRAYEKEQLKDNFMKKATNSVAGSGMLARQVLNGLGLDNLSSWATSERNELRNTNYSIFRNSQKVKHENNLRIKGLEEKRANAKTDEEREEIDRQIGVIKNDTKQNQQISRNAIGRNIGEYALKGIDNLLKDINKKVLNEISKLSKEAVNTLKEVATYDLGNSLFVNSSARNQALKYGLNSSQNYAYSQTSKIMGISGEEDLFYMNNNQRELFSTLMQKEQSIYDKMTQNGTLEGFQEMQVDIALMKQEFVADIVSFIVNNRDAIMYFFKQGMKILEGIMNAVSKMLSIFGGNKTSGYGSRTHTIDASEIASYRTSGTTTDNISYRSETNNNSNKQYQITINNENKGGDSNSLATQVSDRTLASLANFFNS